MSDTPRHARIAPRGRLLPFRYRRTRSGSPSGWFLWDGDRLAGEYGGTPGLRWAYLADGTEVTSDSPCSADTVRGILESAIAEAAS